MPPTTYTPTPTPTPITPPPPTTYSPTPITPPPPTTYAPTPITPPPPKSTPPPSRTVVTSPPTSSVDVSPPHTMDTSTPSSSAHISTPPMSADSTVRSPTSPTHSDSRAPIHTNLPRVTNQPKKPITIIGREFSSQMDCAHTISNIIKGHYTGVWTSWTKVPKPHRDMWFIEFRDVYTWKKGETYAIRKVWESRGSDIMRSLMAYRRSVRKQPEWIGFGIWEQLLKKWDGVDYKKIGKQAKENRASDCGVRGFTKYHGGNISFIAHRENIKKETGEDPGIAGTFKKLNSKTTKDGEEDSFNKNFNAWSNDTNDDDDSSSDDEPPNEYEVWLETIGNCNKRGRMPGFGGEAKFIRQGCGPSFSRRMEENEQSIIIANLRKDIEEIKKANVQPHPNPHYYHASHGYYAGPGYYYPPSGFPAPPNPNASVQPTPPGYHSEASHSAPPGFHLPFVHQTSQPSLPPHSFTNLLANNQPFSEPRTFTNLLENKQPAPNSLSGENDDEGRGERLGGEWFESE
ncbi:hypothetical protein ACFE04_002760 [Oxalis oulophora]